MPNNDHVEFVARDGVALYTGRGVTAHEPGKAVRLPKAHAEAFSHLAEKPAAGPAKLTEGGASN